MALKNDILTEIQIPTITINKKQKNDTNRRPAFTKEEYDELTQFLFDWPNEKHCKNKERRWLLKLYVTFLVHSSLRPGTLANGFCIITPPDHIQALKDRPQMKFTQLSLWIIIRNGIKRHNMKQETHTNPLSNKVEPPLASGSPAGKGGEFNEKTLHA